MIAVTGLGIISAIGNNVDETLLALRQKKTGIGKIHHLNTRHMELPVGEVNLSNAEMKQALGIDVNKIVSRTALMGALAVQQAIDGANLSKSVFQEKKVVLVSGTTVGGMDVTEHFFTPTLIDKKFLYSVNKHDVGSCTQEIRDLLGVNCEICTISTACSSAANSIIVGCEMLETGEADIVIVGGTEALSKFHLNGFNALMIFDHNSCKPFDQQRNGLNLGEGAAYLVLEKNKSKAWAYISGYGNRCDAFHQTASSAEGKGAFLAMKEALNMSGLAPKQISYVNAHGTGTPNNDISESRALRHVFGDSLPPVSSTKSFTGHTTSASGSIEAVICILAINKQFVPANLGWKEQDLSCIVPSQGENYANLEHVICNSFGFGGNDSAIVISKHPNEFKRPRKKLQHFEMVADVEIDGDVSDYASYIKPAEGRRMSRLLKAAMITSLRALKEAEVDCPDAIITATSYGMMENSEKLLTSLYYQGEESFSPTLFMQSTHNTISSAVAIRIGCHGYNITYSQGNDSLTWALRDAKRLILTGKAKTVLVGYHDEITPLFQQALERLGREIPPKVYSRSMILKAK